MDDYYAYLKEEVPEAVKRYVEEHGEEAKYLGTPTVAAMRHGAVVGVVSTHADETRVICGPLIAKSAFIGNRLMRIYEKILRKTGCSGYLFYAKLSNPSWIRALCRVNGVSYHDADDSAIWFKRTF
jgi:hypothetical protein